MLWGIIASLFSAVSIVSYKKVLVCAGTHKLTSPWLLWMMNIELAGVMLMVYFLIPNIVPINFSLVHGDIYLLGFIGLSTLLGIASELMSQYAYKNEKISILTPFGEFGQIITIILGFLIFSETSVTTFVFALIAASALIISSIDFHVFHVNRYCMVLGFSGFMRALATIVVGYVLLQITPLTLISIDVTIVSILLLFFLLLSPKFSLFIPNRKSFLPIIKLITINNILWLITYTITLFLIKNLGIVTTALLSMITMILTIFSSYFFFRDIPTRKNIIIAIIVMMCIVGGVAL